jgi:hypothetical protein
MAWRGVLWDEQLRSVNGLTESAKNSFEGPIRVEELKPGDVTYRAYESGKTKPFGQYATDAETASRIFSTESAQYELALRGTSNARPDRLVALEITRPITVYYGQIKGGGVGAYQYYIQPGETDAFNIIGERILK